MSGADEKKAIIASRLREARKMAGFSQAQVAKILGLHRPSISEAEAGNRRVSAEELVKLAQLYDVSATWLLGEGADKLDVHETKVQLAARELKKLKSEDLDRLLTILASMRRGERHLDRSNAD
jgi:transcriptional regulator with XRE-family HTH domain